MAKEKKIKAVDIAKWFLSNVDRQSGDDITHLKLQKLIYYSQAWWLANKGEPLFEESFEAWAHGPVVKAVWNEYRDYGWESLPVPKSFPALAPEVQNYLKRVYDIYGKYSAKFLEDLTHKEEPWLKARGNLSPEARSDSIISTEVMKEFYKNKIINDGNK